ncbi:hypothetical protein [Propioniciclava flava]
MARRRCARDGVTDPAPEPTQEDFDTVLAVLSVLNWATLGAHVLGPPVSTESGARIIARLLA